MTAVHWWRCPCCQFITATCRTEKAAAAARDANLSAQHPAAAQTPLDHYTFNRRC